MNKTADFTQGPIVGPLLKFSLPILLALFLQALYGAVDLMVVGKYAMAEDVSGVAVGSHLMMTITNLVSSFAMGTTIYLGQTLGQGDKKSGSRIIGTSIVIFLAAGLFLSICLPTLSGSLAKAMNAPVESFGHVQRYIAICGAGSVMIVSYNVLGSIMRGLGDSKTPLMTVVIASVCNIIGDVILVAGFHLGASGAAIATVSSQTISVLASLFILSRRELPFTLTKKDIRISKPVLQKIVHFGAPIALQDFLVGLSFLVIQAIANTLGLVASAGVGVAEKVCGFIMLIPLAFMQAMSAYVAQNHGAGKDDRALQGLKLAIALSTAFGVVMFYVSFFHGDLLCSIFANDARVVVDGARYLKAYGIDCLFTCFLFCFIGFYNGLGRTRFVMIQGVTAAFLIRIPVAYLMRRFVGTLFSIGLSIPCSTIYQIIICFIFYFMVVKKQKVHQESEMI